MFYYANLYFPVNKWQRKVFYAYCPFYVLQKVKKVTIHLIYPTVSPFFMIDFVIVVVKFYKSFL